MVACWTGASVSDCFGWKTLAYIYRDFIIYYNCDLPYLNLSSFIASRLLLIDCYPFRLSSSAGY